MIILGIDMETTGLDIPTIGITEIGMVLWDTTLRAPVKVYGFVVDPGPGAAWSPGVEKINGLSPELCAEYGMHDERALRLVLSWYNGAEVACAHNGTVFDRPLLEAWAARHGQPFDRDKVWIDTRCDLEIPERNSTRLTYMAADHSFLNPVPHRAVFDVMTMLKVLDAYDLPAVMEMARSPAVRVKALVSFEQKDLAKDRGYHAVYEGGKFQHWEMVVKQIRLEQERAGAREAGFDIAVLP